MNENGLVLDKKSNTELFVNNFISHIILKH